MLEQSVVLEAIKAQLKTFVISLLLAGYWILLGNIAPETIQITKDLFVLGLDPIAWFITLLCIALYGAAIYFTVVIFKIIRDSKV